LYLETLHLYHFRNHIWCRFEFCPHINLIIGPNGVGKTNLLEAIHLLAFMKGFRPHSELVNFHSSEYRIEATFLPYHWTLKIQYKKEGGRKQVYWNEKPYQTLGEHIGKVPLVLVSPNDIDLIKGGSPYLRLWINKTLSLLSSTYLNDLLLYRRYLEDYKKTLLDQKVIHSTLLEVLETKLFQVGRRITLAREAFFNAFNPLFSMRFQFFHYDRQARLEYAPTLKGEQNVFSHRRHLYQKKGRIFDGPHLDRIHILLDGKDARIYASQGQIKALLFSLKLAEVQIIENQKGISPILLLDDVGDRLDQSRLQQLFSYLFQKESQIFITDTTLERIQPFLSKAHNYQIISLEEGEKKPIS